VTGKSVKTQTYDKNYLGICTNGGPIGSPDQGRFWEFIKSDSPDILKEFQHPDGRLSNPITYYPGHPRYFVRTVKPEEIKPDTIVHCAGGTSKEHDYWRRRADKIKIRKSALHKMDKYLLNRGHDRPRSAPPLAEGCTFNYCSYTEKSCGVKDFCFRKWCCKK